MVCDVCARRGRKKLTGDAAPARIARLSVELLNSDGLAELTIGGAWTSLRNLLLGRHALCTLYLEMDICSLALTHLRRIGSAAEWMVSGTLMQWP